MESRTAGESSRRDFKTQAPSQAVGGEEDEQLEAAIRASLSYDLDAQSPSIDENSEQPYLAFPQRVLLDPIEKEQAQLDGATHACLSDSLGVHTLTPNQASGQTLKSNSQDEQVSGLEPDMPLGNYEEANAVQPQAIAEDYVPWLGDSSHIGIFPRIHVYMLSFVSSSTLVVGYVAVGILMLSFFGMMKHTRLTMKFIIHMAMFFSYIVNIFTGLLNWSPLLLVYGTLSVNPRAGKMSFLMAIVIGTALFGLFSWANHALSSNNRLFEAWSTGSVPQSFRGCNARVGLQKSSLFEPDIYNTQFARIIHIYDNGTNSSPDFDMELSHSIQVNQTLCDQGFEGNEDLYGLGIRVGIYLQWISSLIANNLLPEDRKGLQKVYLIFSLAICIATVVSSFTTTCIFSIEIELLYWMYWGGFVCVFVFSPCSVRLGSETKWIGLDWITVILFTTHTLMTYHGIWFIWYAYDQTFSRMPCGTYQFFFVPMLDPSDGFWAPRDFLTQLIIPLAAPLLLVFPFIGVLLASEIRHSIQTGATYQMFFPGSNISGCDQSQNTGPNASAQTSLGLRIFLKIKRLYRRIRRVCSLPSHGRRGIRLVTPIDVRNRRYVALLKP